MQHPVKAISAYYTRHNILPPQTIEYMEYALLSLYNEWIKIIIYGIIFAVLDQDRLFWYVLFILYPIRWISGGLHARTFWGCFICSFITIFLLIYAAPLLPCPAIPFSLALALLCILAYRHVPYTPAFRPIKNARTIRSLRCLYITVFLIWIMVLNLAAWPDKYISIGFYTLLFQVAQLFIPRKGGN